jgi:hypothetical protein
MAARVPANWQWLSVHRKTWQAVPFNSLVAPKLSRADFVCMHVNSMLAHVHGTAAGHICRAAVSSGTFWVWMRQLCNKTTNGEVPCGRRHQNVTKL